MSPVSRGRRSRKNRKSTRRSAPPGVLAAPEVCDCPACTDADFDPQQLIDQLVDGAEELVGAEDPLDVELAGAVFVSIGDVAGEQFEDALIGGFIPELEARAGAAALAMLLAIGSVTGGRPGQAASAAAERLVRAGIPRPAWAAELDEPVTLTGSWHLADTQGTASMLACVFRRAGRSHTVVMSVDHLDCGAADNLLLIPEDHLDTALELIQADGNNSGFEITKERLDPAELRWKVETALDARAVHDRDDLELGVQDPPDEDDDLPGYRTLAVLLRARMRALPAPGRPPEPHGTGNRHRAGLIEAQMPARLSGDGGNPFDTPGPAAPRRRAAVAAPPAERRPTGAAAPVYQIKVALRGAKPPIWRRLEVPADISLARLHTVIQVAFDWYDGHLHVFETPFGEFGVADAELGHGPEAAVTLEQVAPDAQSRIRYTYDFGDDWEHDILVEKVLDRDETVSYPRCTGGRRAAPPEDCGGIWGYADLVEVLADPAHPEHDDKLGWLGLDDAAQFDPAAFDAGTVTRALSRLP